ncbi:ABC transporter permease/M1 family aminopeptidase [Paraliomyxa miuraensis]|uniref:ABC transporter permease/M1 family aminopeptidase n=1 Tax=Paraliomyxa miuraensis TaxID=376150 RepID=UPI002257AEA9|nr:M1 family aminopeptidase [Paraliomyxa miuraensis]MCX4246771.1 M1 family aminopeptidase [Paraliomyxa miuraensis]
MLASFLRFELRYRFRQPAVYIFAAVFALLTFGATTSDAVVIGGGTGQTAINAPFVVIQTLGFMSALSVLLVTAFVSTAVLRDFELGTDALFFTKPVRKLDLLAGRFLGSVLVSTVVMVFAALGMAIGTVMPWLDPARLVPVSAAPYLYALFVLVVPNLLVMGSFFFALATLSRRVLLAYVGVLAFFVIFSVADAFVADLDNDMLAALVDPFGLSSLSISTRYWTVVERNTSLPPLTGALVLNRLLWLGLGAACFALTVRRFSLSTRARRPKAADATAVERARTDAPLRRVTPRFGRGTALAQLWHVWRVETGTVLRGKAFLVILLFGSLNMVGNALGTIDQLFGTPVLPVTGLIVRVADQVMNLFALIVITFYAGELYHQERQRGLHEVHDAMPVPSWVPLLGKLGALWAAVLVLLGAAGLTGMLFQLASGYSRVEPGLYVQGLWGLALWRWALVCVLALFFQVLVNHKYLGFLLMLLFFVAQMVLPALDLQHGLYRYAWSPEAPYSDMNGYGHFLRAVVWYKTYWSLLAAGLVVVGNLLWVRGTDAGLRTRLREARRRTTGLHVAMLGGLAVGAFVVGGAILHHTTDLNRYRTGDQLEDAAVLYEQTYKAQWDGAAQPRVIAAALEVDIWPQEREVALRGTITLKNRHDAPIDRLMVSVEPTLEVESLGLPDDAMLSHDEELGVRIYRLEPAMAPGAELQLPFSLRFREAGIKNHASVHQVVGNGTFFNSGYVPRIGYDPRGELADPNERRKRGLPERERLRPPSDMKARANTYLSREGDWIEFSATVSTSREQIALAPGYLVREWEEGDRRYFRYEMDVPILDFYAFLSADYQVARDHWNDVAIEVYHHDTHDMNVPRMIDAVKASLEYYTANFSPYQHRQVRIVEFPRYERFAQSFPNTIPYSESIGFIADLRDADRIDYVYYVTAHEVAHQWWGHQVMGGEVQGSTMLVESLSQYSALMVMEKTYGRAKMQKFLEYELDRYLKGRGAEVLKEVPLSLVENQPYIHYNKGSLVFYALREVMGEEVLNGVLARFIADKGFQSPPFTTSLELVERIRAAMPERFGYLVEDLLETITLYDNRALRATATALADGRWQVELELSSRKLRADEEGAEHEVPLDDWLEIGVYGEDADAEPLYLEWHRISEANPTIRVEVSGRPARAGVDPRVLFVDREPDDNVRVVEARE